MCCCGLMRITPNLLLSIFIVQSLSLLQFTDALNTTISTAPKQQLTTTIPSTGHPQHVHPSQQPYKNRSSSLAPNDILSWKEHLLARYRGCSSLLLNDTGRISEAERNELEAYLKNENLAEYKKAVLSYVDSTNPNASLITNRTIGCFKRFDIISEKLERLNRARHKFVLHASPLPIVAAKKVLNDHRQRRPAHIQKFLSHWQLRKLHSYFIKTGDSESIIKALRQHFRQLPMIMQSQLIDDFFQYSPSLRRGRIHPVHQHGQKRSATDRNERPSRRLHKREIHPKGHRLVSTSHDDHRLRRVKNQIAHLDDEHLYWLSNNQSEEIRRMQSERVDEMQILMKIGDYFSHLNSATQKNVSETMKPVCNAKVTGLFGRNVFEELHTIYEHFGATQNVYTKYREFVARLQSERERNQAERVWSFCKKIYRIAVFKPAFLTVWLGAEQKRELQEMIQDPKINDYAVYDRLFEFYKKTKGEKKTEAKESIESGCRWFITHMLGEDIADMIEEHRLSGNYSAQMLSAELVRNVAEIEDAERKIKTQRTLSICERIYLGYSGDCFCNGHSSTCDLIGHFCVDCADNTDGVQCEQCSAGYSGSALADSLDGCTEMSTNQSSSICTCNRHSSSCDSDGICQDCEHNTTGTKCEHCKSGFYGDATQGTKDDCIKCPCGEGGECFVNSDSLLECRVCNTETPNKMCKAHK